MSNLRQAAQQAILLCQWIDKTQHQRGSINGMAAQVKHALEQALAEPEQKPQTTHWEGCEAVHPECKAAPIPRRPLTDEEIVDIWAGVSMDYDDEINIIELARALERAHGIKEYEQ